MNRLLAACIALWLLPGVAGSQTEDCPPFTSSKSEKALEKAADAGRYEAEKRISILEDAWENDPACYACLQALGHLHFSLFKRGAASSYAAEEALTALVGDCPDFHAEPWYELGAIAYANGDASTAIERFTRFLEFPDEYRLGKRYDRQAEDVRAVMDELVFMEAFHAYEDQMELIPVHGVNTPSDEYLPALSPDGSLLFLTHAERVKPKGDVISQVVERFQWSHREAGAVDFMLPEDLAHPFNDGSRYGGASISVDNRELYIAASNPVPSNPENIDIFGVKYEVVGRTAAGGFAYEWGDLTPLPAAVNSPDGWEAQPALAADGQSLFFSAVKAGSIPDADGNPTMDLMVARRRADGSWLPAEPLPELNTAANEKSPFLHPDGKTLYFSSDRKPGGGGYDIWYSRLGADGTWGTPVNVGSPLNTAGDEHGLVVAADGRQAYLGSRRTGTKGLDILGLMLPPPHRAAEVTIIRGALLDAQGLPDTTARVGLLNTATNEREFLEINQDDGTFARAYELTEEEPVVLFTEGPSTSFDALVVAPPPAIASSRAAAALQLRAQPIATGTAYEMRDITYGTNRSELDATSQALLKAFSDYLQRHPDVNVAIHGHTDNVGSAATNQQLSEERAQSVMDFLVSCGIPANRLAAQGFGPSRPKASNDNEAGRAANRRTEFVFTD